MTEFMIINPGTGPIDGTCARDARRNIGAFCRDLAYRSPHVHIERRSTGDFDGKYDYILQRGIRTVTVTMPGLPLDRVKLGPNDNVWLFPRLYVDGNSWLWSFGVNIAKDALLDHDGSAERGYRQSIADCNFVLTNEPRCPSCGTIKDRYLTDYETENPPYGYDRLRCLTCVPIEKMEIRSWNLEAVYRDDSWKKLQHGCVYRVTSRRMPDEATNTADDLICAFRGSRNEYCRLKRGHAAPCKRHWEEIARERIDLPFRDGA